MAKRYPEMRTTCADGINMNVERARPNQCADALNVWAPDGRVVQRPGYRGHFFLLYPYEGTSNVFSIATPCLRAKEVAGVTTVDSGGGLLAVDNLAVGEYHYLGLTTLNNAAATIDYIAVSSIYLSLALAPSNNSNATWITVEYWNGIAWVAIDAKYLSRASGDISADTYPHLAGDERTLSIVVPGDFSQSALVDTGSSVSYTRYWLRCIIRNAALDASCDIGRPLVYYTAETIIFLGLTRVTGDAGKVYMSVYFDGTDVVFGKLNDLNGSAWTRDTTAVANISLPMSVASVPQFNYFFVAVNGYVREVGYSTESDEDSLATVEDRDFAVGSGAPYDKNSVAQLTAFPKAKFIRFFHNRLWIVDLNNIVWWSAAAPYYKVWPALAFASLAEDDPSPATGMEALHEAMVFYKNDSIWITTYEYMGAFDIPQYTIKKVVSGTGCVASDSIVSINNEHIFLGENSIFAFNGAAVRSIIEDPHTGADRLPGFFKRLSAKWRQFATAVHWKAEHCYLLAVPLDGADKNNTVICWDYDNDAIWIWDNMPVQTWVREEGPDDLEQIWFVTKNAALYKWDSATHDHGTAITCEVTSLPFGYQDGYRKQGRYVTVESDNMSGALEIGLLKNRQPQPYAKAVSGATSTLAMTSAVDPDKGTYTFGETLSYWMTRIKRKFWSKTADNFQVYVKSSGSKADTFGLSNISFGAKTFRNR